MPFASTVIPLPAFAETVSAATVIPLPAPTFRVTEPELPPPVKPFPAVTPVISPAGTLYQVPSPRRNLL
jgi:hypothetical protein